MEKMAGQTQIPERKDEGQNDEEDEAREAQEGQGQEGEKDEGEEDEGEDVGPPLPPSLEIEKRAQKKRRRLQFEKVYVGELPSAAMYEKSFMHRDIVTHVVVTRATEFVITASADGVVKFWKKVPSAIEFVKQFRAHSGPVTSLSASVDGKWLATVSAADSSAKIFDVTAFDMVSVIPLGFQPAACEWAHKSGAGSASLIVADVATPRLDFFQTGRPKAIHSSTNVHDSPVMLLRYNHVYDYVVSVDSNHLVEYWRPHQASGSDTRPFPSGLSFQYKSETDLYEFAKSCTSPTSLEISADGSLFACYARDQQVRVFDFLTGKIKRKYDESLSQLQRDQEAATIAGLPDGQKKLDPGDFGRRLVLEKELTEKDTTNVVFDSSGHFIVYATPLGIKIVNIISNTMVRVLGTAESAERFIYLALYQGSPVEAIGTSVKARKAEEPDPTLVASSFEKQRFYLFTSRNPEEDKDGVGRDVFNEKPSRVVSAFGPRGAGHKTGVGEPLATAVTLHTTMGDIVLQLFPELCPRTVENFSSHCRSGYYNLVLFHRVIKSFMIQSGDPRGDGTGGTSIWGEEFEDEIVPSLKHDKEGTLSMANAGPNTNGSQFFISTVSCSWLDGKHTVFGRVTKGMDVVKAIESLKCDKKDRPVNDVKIASVTVV